MQASRLILTLTGLGVIPFLIALVLLLLDRPLLGVTGETLFTSYSLLIASFMAGTLWGQVLREPPAEKNQLIVLLLSNVLTVAAWFAYLLLPTPLLSGLLGVVFLLILQLERQWAWPEGEPDSTQGIYQSLRVLVTALVVVCHVVATVVILL